MTSAQKIHLSPDDFGETFAFDLIKQNVTHFSFIFNTKLFAVRFCMKLNLLPKFKRCIN